MAPQKTFLLFFAAMRIVASGIGVFNVEAECMCMCRMENPMMLCQQAYQTIHATHDANKTHHMCTFPFMKIESTHFLGNRFNANRYVHTHPRAHWVIQSYMLPQYKAVITHGKYPESRVCYGINMSSLGREIHPIASLNSTSQGTGV